MAFWLYVGLCLYIRGREEQKNRETEESAPPTTPLTLYPHPTTTNNKSTPRQPLPLLTHPFSIPQRQRLQEIFTRDGSGTLISRDLYDGIRPATVADVPGIVDIIEPLIKVHVLCGVGCLSRWYPRYPE